MILQRASIAQWYGEQGLSPLPTDIYIYSINGVLVHCAIRTLR